MKEFDQIKEEDLEEIKKRDFLKKPTSQAELRDWFKVFLDLDLPDTHLPDEGSNTSPMEAVWVSFDTYVKNGGDVNPGYIWLSSRDSYKTLGASMLAVALMVFCDATICWLASIEPQSKIALNNVQSFIQKIQKYLDFHGKTVESNNARNLEIVDKNGNRSLVNILVATMASVNGRHVNIVMTDEVDLVRDPRVLDEVQAVASLIGGQFPLKVYFSTRKFAWGNMEGIISKAPDLGLKVLKWDVLDVTEHCDITRRKSNQKSESVYIHPDPPLRSYTEAEYEKLAEVEKKQLEKISVYKGCVGCKLVSQCKTRLGDRSPSDKGKLWKKIDHTINMFRSMSPDMATAQLLCRKPSLSGLVYPRFSEYENVIDINQAIQWLTGEETGNPTFQDLVNEIVKLNIPIYVGGDWGHTASQAFVVTALMPSGEWWILESYAIPGLEFDDILTLAKTIRDKYNPEKWFMDTNQPMFIKTFNKNGMKCADFKKDVAGGIECVRKAIIDSSGKRSMKVIRHDKNAIFLEGMRKHHFKLDSLGNPTDEPDDGEAWSDVCDSLRYIAQNLFKTRSGKPVAAKADIEPRKLIPSSAEELKEKAKELNNLLMKQEIVNRTGDPSQLSTGTEEDPNAGKKKKGIIWSV